MSQARVLVIDDEPDIRDLLSMTLRRMKLSPDTAADLGEARQKLASGRYDLCLTDMKLPDGDGLDLVEWMQTNAPGVPVAVITAHGNVEAAVRALKLGAFDFVSKPLRVNDLRKMVQTALRLEAPDKPAEPAGADERLIGDSEAMEKVRRMIRKVARSQAPVYIFGESGTGKELVARLIHESGPRAGGPFVPVNCGAIPTELMESEFFGHKRGSFTGAVDDKEGLIRSAEGGTLFLDEVGDLPLHMQVKLLRVIQERAVRPVGGTQEIPVDCRFLSASHKDLAAMVADGEFREDLYYRINVIDLRVPPLRERGEDAIVLARHILRRLADTMGVTVPELTAGARECLLQHPYPGNVRELENVLERAMAMSDGGKIDAEDIEMRAAAKGSLGTAGVETGDAPLESQLQDVEREAIIQALEQTRYNKTAAARVLGISFRQLRYRIKKLGLD
jgi:two-component system response regulator PilR (NtrC family)